MGKASFLGRSTVAVIAACVIALGATTLSVAQEPKQGGTLVAAFSADPGGFDPARGPSGMSHIAIEQVFSTLLLLDENAKPYGGLAHTWSSSEDGLTWTFKLREGVKFHNGEALTAEDVAFTFDRIRKPDSGYAYLSQVETIEKVTAVDDLTVEFKLSRPTGPFEIYMAFPGSSIVPKDLVESGWDLNAKPVGSGPFKFVSYEPRSVIKFERNPDYYEKGKPYFDAMEYRIISDPTALSNGMKSGEIHFSNEVPPKDWKAITGQEGMVDAALEGSRYYWLVPNHKQEPLGNAKVRQAIAVALNREAIVRGAFYGQATPIVGGVIPEWNWGYADIDFFKPKGDIEAAKKLLAEAGVEPGAEIKLTMVSSWPPMMSMAPIIQANLSQIGFKATIDTMEVPRYWDEVWGPSKFDLTAMYWLSPLADPDDFVTNTYLSTSPVNTQKGGSKKMDDLLQKAKSAVTRDERKALYREQQKLSLETMDVVPLVNGWVLAAHTDRLKNFKPMRTGFLKTLKDAWLE
ncbi:MAG: ABC transporter substrate-binding protein [Hyphomicrobiales bacterium]